MINSVKRDYFLAYSIGLTSCSYLTKEDFLFCFLSSFVVFIVLHFKRFVNTFSVYFLYYFKLSVNYALLHYFVYFKNAPEFFQIEHQSPNCSLAVSI